MNSYNDTKFISWRHYNVAHSKIINDFCLFCHKFTGYYNRPWEWEQIKQNTQWIVQFGSTDDPFIPFSEQEQVAEGTASEFHKFSDKGHFQSFAFSDLMNILIGKLKQECGEWQSTYSWSF